MRKTTTWDGLPISAERPHGVTVVVYRRASGVPDAPTGPDAPDASADPTASTDSDASAGPDAPDALEILLLHRAHHGPDYEGDWAWTPPAGSRFPGEPVAACARRELHEEAGLALDPRPTDCGTPDWRLYVAEAPPDARVSLAHDPEHDRYAWLPAGEAVARCRPALVAQGLERAIALLREASPGGR